MNKKVFIVEDDEDISELLRFNLTQEGYDVASYYSGDGAVEEIRRAMPDLILLDLMLPGLSGLDICRVLKSDTLLSSIPVVMVSAKGEEADIVVGLELGADDYITKPFSPRILTARVKAVLRRSLEKKNENTDTIHIHGLEINSRKHEVFIQGVQVELTYTEFELLKFLAGRPGWVFTRYQIVDAIRGDDYPVTERSVDVQVAGLRKKMGSAGSVIETVRGVGYRFQEAE